MNIYVSESYHKEPHEHVDVPSVSIIINDTEYRLTEADDMLQISIIGSLIVQPRAGNMIHIKEE